MKAVAKTMFQNPYLEPQSTQGVFSMVIAQFRKLGGRHRFLSRRAIRREVQEKRAQALAQAERRMLTRALLARLVKETMLRAGVLSGQFHFKTLAMDREGTTYNVLIDLDPSAARITADIGALCESRMRHDALARHELAIAAVYWRNTVAVPVTQRKATSERERQQRPAALSDTDFGDLLP